MSEKAEKNICKVNLTEEQISLIDEKRKLEGKTKEQVFEDAVTQLLLPRIGEVGQGHPNFHYMPPLMRGPNIENTIFWLKKDYWQKVKDNATAQGITMHAMLYTAIVNHLNQYKLMKNDLKDIIGG